MNSPPLLPTQASPRQLQPASFKPGCPNPHCLHKARTQSPVPQPPQRGTESSSDSSCNAVTSSNSLNSSSSSSSNCHKEPSRPRPKSGSQVRSMVEEEAGPQPLLCLPAFLSACERNPLLHHPTIRRKACTLLEHDGRSRDSGGCPISSRIWIFYPPFVL